MKRDPRQEMRGVPTRNPKKSIPSKEAGRGKKKKKKENHGDNVDRLLLRWIMRE
jgi:hypothetical protein